MRNSTGSLEKVQCFLAHKIMYQGINLLSLSQIYLFEKSLNRLSDKNLITTLKKFSLDNYAKAASLFFLNNKPRTNIKAKYAFVNDVYNLSMVDNMNAVKASFNLPFIEINTDRRLFRKNSISYYSFKGFIGFILALPQFSRLISSNFSTIVEISKLFGVSKHLIVLNLLESLFIVKCASEIINKLKNLEYLVLNTDVHKTSRALVLLSRQKNIISGVIQHGSPVLEYGYLPVISHQFFTWGEISKHWFTVRNTREEKLILTGTPKADSIFNKILNQNVTDEIYPEKILLIINPIGKENVLRMLQICKDSGIHKKFELTIKLHPSSNDNRNEVDEVFKNEVIVLKDENTHDLLAIADIVITTTSTVGNEAIAFEKPLIQIKFKNLTQRMDYENFDCSHTIHTASELKSLTNDINTLYSKLSNYKNYIENYFFKIDGEASVRIADYISKKPNFD